MESALAICVSWSVCHMDMPEFSPHFCSCMYRSLFHISSIQSRKQRIVLIPWVLEDMIIATAEGH